MGDIWGGIGEITGTSGSDPHQKCGNSAYGLILYKRSLSGIIIIIIDPMLLPYIALL